MFCVGYFCSKPVLCHLKKGGKKVLTGPLGDNVTTFKGPTAPCLWPLADAHHSSWLAAWCWRPPPPPPSPPGALTAGSLGERRRQTVTQQEPCLLFSQGPICSRRPPPGTQGTHFPKNSWPSAPCRPCCLWLSGSAPTPGRKSTFSNGTIEAALTWQVPRSGNLCRNLIPLSAQRRQASGLCSGPQHEKQSERGARQAPDLRFTRDTSTLAADMWGWKLPVGACPVYCRGLDSSPSLCWGAAAGPSSCCGHPTPQAPLNTYWGHRPPQRASDVENPVNRGKPCPPVCTELLSGSS